MAGVRAAIRYAKAVLSLANDQNTAELINTEMKLIATTIAENKDLSDMLQSPVVDASIKKSALLEIFKGANALTVNLIDTLITNKRLTLLDQVASRYNQLYNEFQGNEVATVTTATPISEELKITVLAKLKTLTGKDVEVKNIVDQSILGGFILRIGDKQYNASVSDKLNKLKREFSLN